jgi:predicted RNA binding protein YcfA (HicA-like mRNA interferase family)
MSSLGPISRSKLIRAPKRAGFDGPYSGSDHAFMQKDDLLVRIPNPHGNDIGPNLLAEILKQAGISRKQWESLR